MPLTLLCSGALLRMKFYRAIFSHGATVQLPLFLSSLGNIKDSTDTKHLKEPLRTKSDSKAIFPKEVLLSRNPGALSEVPKTTLSDLVLVGDCETPVLETPVFQTTATRKSHKRWKPLGTGF